MKILFSVAIMVVLSACAEPLTNEQIVAEACSVLNRDVVAAQRESRKRQLLSERAFWENQVDRTTAMISRSC